jgi:hypothetical protein
MSVDELKQAAFDALANVTPHYVDEFGNAHIIVDYELVIAIQAVAS